MRGLSAIAFHLARVMPKLQAMTSARVAKFGVESAPICVRCSLSYAQIRRTPPIEGHATLRVIRSVLNVARGA